MKEKASFLPFGIGQDFLRFFIVQHLILIIVENSVDIKKTEANKVKRARGEEKYIVQVKNHFFIAPFLIETKV